MRNTLVFLLTILALEKSGKIIAQNPLVDQYWNRIFIDAAEHTKYRFQLESDVRRSTFPDYPVTWITHGRYFFGNSEKFSSAAGFAYLRRRKHGDLAAHEFRPYYQLQRKFVDSLNNFTLRLRTELRLTDNLQDPIFELQTAYRIRFAATYTRSIGKKVKLILGNEYFLQFAQKVPKTFNQNRLFLGTNITLSKIFSLEFLAMIVSTPHKNGKVLNTGVIRSTLIYKLKWKVGK